jgi:hypothetical protein
MRPALPSWIAQSLVGIATALALSAGLGLTAAGQTAPQAPPQAGSRFARCQNVPGGRTCGSCPDGYAGDGYLGCFDVNDCPAGDCSSKIPAVPPNDKPPVVTSSGDVTVAATSEAGAQATFKATAKDTVDGTIQAFCTPRTGSTFKVGKTTVTCWAYNTRGEIGRTTLTVTVTPAQ